MDNQRIRELAKKCGVTSTMISCIARGTRRPSPELAKRLEDATGVKREAWIWPNRYNNCWMEEIKK